MKTTIATLAIILSITSTFARRGGHEKQEGMREAMEACAAELGISKPERGSRLSEADRESMDSCLSAKGFEKPERGSRENR